MTGYEGAQDYDLLLRLMERTDRIHHIPKVLYHWRKTAASTATLRFGQAVGDRGGYDGRWTTTRAESGSSADVSHGPHPGLYRFRRAIRGEPLVSIVIPTTGRPARLGETCWRDVPAQSRENGVVAISKSCVATDSGDVSAAAREALRPLRHAVHRIPGAGRHSTSRTR